ncbi:MAG: divergent polysaccharide deacetylase family protein, partial [Desulfonatronovibrio sp.]
MWILTFGITLVTLALILLLPHKDEPAVTQEVHKSQVAESRSVPTEKKPQSAGQTSLKPKAFTYEEKIGADFDLRVWEADMAILQTLSLMGHESDRMIHKKIETRFFYGTPYHYQEIVIYTNDQRDDFLKKLKQNMERFLSYASLIPTENKYTWSVNINGQVTHLINLERIVEKPLPGTGRLVIIIDDIGGSLEYARKLSRLDFPVILSILPYKPETKEVVEFARKNDLETMLHIPMEPVTYSQGVNPGPGALFVNMDGNEIRRRVKDNLQQVPGAIGANNHMGSRFTQDTRGMEIVFDELQKNHLF